MHALVFVFDTKKKYIKEYTWLELYQHTFQVANLYTFSNLIYSYTIIHIRIMLFKGNRLLMKVKWKTKLMFWLASMFLHLIQDTISIH